MRSVVLSILLTLTSLTCMADCDLDVTPEQCNLGQTYDFYKGRADIEAGFKAKEAAAKAAEEVTEEAGEEVVNANRATEPSDPFAGKLHNSYQDFLNFFSFAINKVDESENGQALIVRFNPIRTGSDVFGGTLTVTKPGVSDLVKSTLPETGRTDLVTTLEGQLGELDDVSVSVSWARQTTKCSLDRDPTDRCWGRDRATYRDLLSHALTPMLEAPPPPPEDPFERSFELAKLVTADELAAANRVVENVKLAGKETDPDLAKRKAEARRDAVKALANARVRSSVAIKSFFTKSHIADVASLIDNQPQWTSSASYHDGGRYGGPPSASATFELQFGNGNLNAIRSKCAAGDGTCLQKEIEARLKAGISTVKWVFSGSYLHNDAYGLADLGKDAAGKVVTVPDFKPFTQKSTWEVKMKGQGGGELSATVGDKRLRADGSIEFERVTGDEARRKNRLVATGTITVPFGDNMSLPLSITWANKEKYLGDHNDQLGAHIGISYRLPELFGKK